MSNRVLLKITIDAKQARFELDALSRAFTRFGAQVRSLAAMSSQAVSGVRQIAQGIQNLGWSMSFLVGIPLTKMLQATGADVIDFQKQLVEVQKTTGLSADAIMGLSDTLRQMGLATSTSTTELAGIAAEAGRVGIGLKERMAGDTEGAIRAIESFVRVVDQMQISTVLSAEEAAEAFGRFVAVFDDIDTSNLHKLGSAINELGQSASVNEEQIVGAMMKIAPAGATLGMTAAEVAGLATAITQLSESASRAGTRTRSALEQMAKNYDKAAALIGVSSSRMSEMINEDALAAFMKLTSAIGEIEDKTLRLNTASEIFGTTGANAVLRLSNSFPQLVSMVTIANDEFSRGTSLQIEFDRAMGSVSNMLGALRNTALEASKTFAMDLLPIFSDFIGAAIAGIKTLTGFIAQLSTKQKLLIIGIAALLTVGLPVVALIGSLAFGFAMILNGVVNLIGGLAGLIATFLTLGSGASVMSAILTSLISVVGTGLVVALLKSLKVFDKVIEKLREVGANAANWGGNLVAEIAGGIVSAASTLLVNALTFVAEIIESFWKAESPPKKGPLSTIDEWGKALIAEFLGSFLRADFGVLSKIGNIISRVLRGLVVIGKMAEDAFGPSLAAARELVAEIIAKFNETGQVSEAAFGRLREMLGDSADEIEKLLRLQLKYNSALMELERIQRKKTDIAEAYDAEIRAIQMRTDLTAAEKAALIKQARERRDLALANAATEESAAQKGVNSLQEQLSWQEEFVNAMLDQNSVWEQHRQALDRMAKAVKDLAKTIADLINDLLEQLRINEEMQALYQSEGLDPKPLLREELNLRKRLLAALLKHRDELDDKISKMRDEGASVDELARAEAERDGVLQQIASTMSRIGELSKLLGVDTGIDIPTIDDEDYEGSVKTIIESLQGLGENTATAIGNFGTALSNGALAFQLFMRALKAEPIYLEEFGGLSEAGRTLLQFGINLRKTYDKIKATWEDIEKRFNTAKDNIGKAIDGIVEKAKPLFEGVDFSKFGSFQASAESIVENIPIGDLGGSLSMGKLAPGEDPFIIASEGAQNFGDKLSKLGVIAVPLGIVLSAILKKVAGSAFKFSSSVLFPGVSKTVGPLFKLLSKGLIRFGYELKLVGGKVWSWGIKPITNMGLTFKQLLNPIKLVKVIVVGFGASLQTIIAVVTTAIGILAALAAVVAIVAGVITYMKDNWERFSEIFTKVWDQIKTGVRGFVTNFMKALGLGEEKMGSFKEMIVGAWQYIYARLEPVFAVIAEGIAVIAQIIGWLAENVLPPLGSIIGSIFKGVGRAIGGVIRILGGLVDMVVGFFEGLFSGDWSKFEKGFNNTFMGIAETLWGFFEGLGGIFWGVYDMVANFVKTVSDFFIGLWNTLFGNSIIPDIVNAFKKWLAKPAAFFKKMVASIKKALAPLIMIFNKAVRAMMPIIKFLTRKYKEGGLKGLFEGLKQAWPVLKNAMAQLLPMFLGYLQQIGASIWGWITGTLLPALGGLIATGYEFLKANLPSWIAAILQVLANVATAIWGWITGTAIPAIAGFIAIAAEYIKTNGPAWWEKFKEILGAIVAGIWEWITGTAVPAIASFIGMAADYIRENAPGWLLRILDVLRNIAEAIIEWALTTGIPALGEFISGAWQYIKENMPTWLAALKSGLSALVTAIYNWVVTKALPAIKKLITDGLAILKDIGVSWLKKINEGLDKLKERFKTVFEGIKDTIVGILKGAWNKIIEGIEWLINQIIDGVNAVIRIINSLIQYLPGVNPIPEIRHVTLPRLAKGGIAMTEMAAVIGDKPEAIIPLDRLDDIIGRISSRQAEQGQGINIVVQNPVVRNDDDLATIIDAVGSELGRKLQAKMYLRGRALGY